MLLPLILTLCISSAPAPKVCTVTDINDNIITVEQSENLYAFRGTNFQTEEKIIAVFAGDQIIEIF